MITLAPEPTKSKAPIRAKLVLARERLRTLQRERSQYLAEAEQATVRADRTGLKINKVLAEVSRLEEELR